MSPRLEKRWAKLGDPATRRWSACAGARVSTPGMTETVLNLGLNDKSVEGLAGETGDERLAFDSYRRFISMYARSCSTRRRAVRHRARACQGAGTR